VFKLLFCTGNHGESVQGRAMAIMVSQDLFVAGTRLVQLAGSVVLKGRFQRLSRRVHWDEFSLF
jgi:hypothetical protein